MPVQLRIPIIKNIEKRLEEASRGAIAKVPDLPLDLKDELTTHFGGDPAYEIVRTEFDVDTNDANSELLYTLYIGRAN